MNSILTRNDDGTLDFRDLYAPYDELLMQRVGVSWFEARLRYEALGNSPGIYPDTALLLDLLAGRPDVKKVVEFGAGMSSLYLALTCQRRGTELHSFEEDMSWGVKTDRLLESYGLAHRVESVDLPRELTGYPETDFATTLARRALEQTMDADLVFLDGALRTAAMRARQIQRVPWIVLDDAEGCSSDISAFLIMSGRTNWYMFERGGRLDRMQWVCGPQNMTDIDPTCQYLRDYFVKHIPVLGRW
jgi:hypothetical protein